MILLATDPHKRALHVLHHFLIRSLATITLFHFQKVSGRFREMIFIFLFSFIGAQIIDLQQRVNSTVYRCELWMTKSLTCTPPKFKIFKFKWRLQKALNDGIWHLNGREKCEVDDEGQ